MRNNGKALERKACHAYKLLAPCPATLPPACSSLVLPLKHSTVSCRACSARRAAKGRRWVRHALVGTWRHSNETAKLGHMRVESRWSYSWDYLPRFGKGCHTSYRQRYLGIEKCQCRELIHHCLPRSPTPSLVFRLCRASTSGPGTLSVSCRRRLRSPSRIRRSRLPSVRPREQMYSLITYCSRVKPGIRCGLVDHQKTGKSPASGPETKCRRG
nr:hypothetical protein CFP56_03157 [Quercus suber]